MSPAISPLRSSCGQRRSIFVNRFRNGDAPGVKFENCYWCQEKEIAATCSDTWGIEDEYTRRRSSNKEYAFQSVYLSKLTNTIVGIHGLAIHEDADACHQQEFEIIAQLRGRYPYLSDRVDEVAGTTHHLLSYKRQNCSVTAHLTDRTLQLPCSSKFHVYCSAQAAERYLNISASNTEYSELARDEAVSFEAITWTKSPGLSQNLTSPIQPFHLPYAYPLKVKITPPILGAPMISISVC